MARTALYAPAHRVMPRGTLGSLQPGPNAAPSIDLGGHGLQDPRLVWNTGNSASGAQALGWYMTGPHPIIDFVPSTLTTTAISAAAVPSAGTPLVLVSSSGAGINVLATPLFVMPSLNTIPSGTLCIDASPAVVRFGTSDYTCFYDPGTIVGRAVSIHSVGDDSGATFAVAGYDTYGFPLHETITGAATGTVTGKKAFKFITSITPAGTLSGSNVSAGQSDVYGLPIVLNATTALMGFWNNLIITGAGTATAAVTTAASATTGDVRGTYLVGSASDGTKRLQIYMHPSLAAMSGAQGLINGLVGVPQF